MTRVIREAIVDALNIASGDESVRAVLLTGANENFSAGGDVEALMKIEKQDFRSYLAAGHETVRTLWKFEKPAIAAIDGVAVGGGVALALCCDHILVSDRAKLGFSFTRIGLLPDWGTLFTLPRRVGRARSENLFLTGRFVNGPGAVAMGLADECHPGEDLQNSAIEIARQLGRIDAETYAVTKRASRSIDDRLESVLEFELQAQQSRFKSPAFLDGVAPFLPKS